MRNWDFDRSSQLPCHASRKRPSRRFAKTHQQLTIPRPTLIWLDQSRGVFSVFQVLVQGGIGEFWERRWQRVARQGDDATMDQSDIRGLVTNMS